MTKELSEYIKMVIRHLRRVEPDRVYSEDENITLLFVTNGAQQYGVTDEMTEYIETHPDAGLEELMEYFYAITPELEIVDDEELTDEERADQDDW